MRLKAQTIRIVLFGISLFMLCTSVSCNKTDDDVIPTGDHTFSCYINGEFFVPKGNIGSIPYNDGLSFLRNEYFESEYFRIEARNTTKNITVYFSILDFSIDTFNLTESNGLFDPSDPNDINHAIVRINGIKYLSKENSGTVTFTVVTDTHVKGTFEFTLYNENDESDVIHITHGNFDD